MAERIILRDDDSCLSPLNSRHVSALLVLFEITMRRQLVQIQKDAVPSRCIISTWQLIKVSRLVPEDKTNSGIQISEPGLVFKGSMYVHTQVVHLCPLPFLSSSLCLCYSNKVSLLKFKMNFLNRFLSIFLNISFKPLQRAA